MSTIIILGAGATAGASRINSELKPPLLKNLSCVLNPTLEIFTRGTDSPKIFQAFKEILNATNTWDDFELLFTLLQVLERIRSKSGKRYVGLDQKDLRYLSRSDLQRIIDDDTQLSGFSLNRQELECLRNLVDYYAQTGMDTINAPLNLMTFFRRALYEYLYESILSVHCIYHLKLFNRTTPNDAVVTFNYDLIADYSLFNLGKLSKSSFEGLGFTNIYFPSRNADIAGVKFLKVHGSFNWTTKVEALTEASIDEVYYELVPLNQTQNGMTYGNTTFDLILPFRHKSFIYESIPIYERHIKLFMDILRVSDSIVLVGKNFLNADKELADLIRAACVENRKTMTVIDPKSENIEWVHYHESLFNARLTNHWISLEEFYKESNE